MTRGPDPVPPPRKQVLLHIGAPKTGTSYLQAVLARNRLRLAGEGILVPPGSWVEGQLWPVLDVLGSRPLGERVDAAAGAWQRFLEHVRTYDGRAVLLSMEFLVKARPHQVKAIAEDLADTDLHVVITARDLGRQLPAGWQESVQNGRTWAWKRYLTACSTADSSAPARHFRRGQDVAAMVRTWSEHVPADRIHVVTVPRVGPSEALWDRFAQVLGVDPSGFDLDVAFSNPSLGAESAEVMRLVNSAHESIDRGTARVLKHVLAKRVLSGRPGETKVVVPEEFRPWVVEQSRALVAGLRDLGPHVVGDLDDIVADFEGADIPLRLDESAVLAAAVDGLAGLVREFVEAQRSPAPGTEGDTDTDADSDDLDYTP